MTDCIIFKYPVARKQHRCECVRQYTKTHPHGRHVKVCHIERGQKYEQQSGIDSNCDGPFRIKLCLFHAAVCQAIWKREGSNGWSFEGIDHSYPWSEYIEITSSAKWRWWLSAIREAYGKRGNR